MKNIFIFHITFFSFLDKGMIVPRNIVSPKVALQPFVLQYIVCYLIALQYIYFCVVIFVFSN